MQRTQAPNMMSYLANSFSPVSIGRSLQGTKDLEWIFVAVRSLGIPVILLMAWLHQPSSPLAMVIVAALMGIASLAASIMNQRITSIRGQKRLSLTMLAVDAILVWAILFLFAYDFNTAAYAYFAIIIIEGAMRFGLLGSMIMAVVFAVGLYGAMLFRLWEYEVRFSASGYAFWSLFMVLVAVAIGLIVQEAQRERNRSAKLAKESAILAERQRIAQDMHDTVLKTLHGLVMESYVLRKRYLESPVAKEKVLYIEEVCRRSTQQIRDVIYELRTDREDENESLFAQLNKTIDTWKESTGITTNVSFSGDDHAVPLVIGYNLRNVLSEALTNIQKHALATRVAVSVSMTSEELRIEIHDNGCGINPASGNLYNLAGNQQFGILGMKERVEQINGHFSIENNQGTTLLITVPIAPTRRSGSNPDQSAATTRRKTLSV